MKLAACGAPLRPFAHFFGNVDHVHAATCGIRETPAAVIKKYKQISGTANGGKEPNIPGAVDSALDAADACTGLAEVSTCVRKAYQHMSSETRFVERNAQQNSGAGPSALKAY